MNRVSLISATVVLAATAAVLFVFPSSVTLSVGDSGSRVNEIARYGYGKSIFSLRHKKDADGERLESSAFAIGPNGWHLLIWHNSRIDSMTHFRYEQPVPETYGEWYDVKNVESFSIERPSSMPFLFGLLILGVAGFCLSRFPKTSTVLFAILLIFVGLMVLAMSTIAETFAIMPALFGIGWVFAAVFGCAMSKTPTNVKPEPN